MSRTFSQRISPEVLYVADHEGMHDFVNSSQVGRAMADVARDMASIATQTGESEYGHRERIVTGGRDNSERAGAEVYDMRRERGEPSPDAWPSRVLVNLARSYRMRGN